MLPALAAIPYTTFPTIELGPITLRTFGIMVALGVVPGSPRRLASVRTWADRRTTRSASA